MTKRSQRLPLLLCLTLLLLLPTASYAWQGKVVAITDGDTIQVLHDGKAEKIRLYGIDCPEKRQDFGTKAKQFTSGMVFGRTVVIDQIDVDCHGRIVAVVKGASKCVNEELIMIGLAWVYLKYCKRPFCSQWRQYQEDARARKVGL